MKKHSQLNKKSGYIALVTVLMLSAVSIVLATSFTQLSIGEGQASQSQITGERSLELTEACAEEGLMRVQKSVSYVGTYVLSIPANAPAITCTLTISVGQNQLWTLLASAVPIPAASPAAARSIQVYFNRNTKITIQSWTEL